MPLFRPSFAFVLLASFVTWPGSPPADAAEATPSAIGGEAPNIVIILADDLGYGDVGAFNPDSRIPTPHMNRLAAEGMRFTDAHAPGPLCHLSRYGLMTGRLPFRAQVGRWSKHAVIEQERLTLPEMLQEHGYQTAMVGKWHLGFDEAGGYSQPLPGGPVDQGFGSFFGIRASTDIPPYFYISGDRAVKPPTERIEANNSDGWSPIQGEFWRAGGIAPDLKLDEVLPRFADEAVSVIEQYAGRPSGQKPPLFLYVAFPAPHTPWLPAEEYRGTSGASMYGDFTVMTDAMAGRILDALETSGLAEHTIVIVTSDNGPTWYDEDTERYGHDASGGFRGMKADAWEAGHRMPFVVRWPGIVEPGSVSPRLICFTDIMATLAELLQIELPSDAAPDSVSFLPALQQPGADSKTSRESLVIQSGRGLFAVRQGPWKLINGPNSGGFSDRGLPKIQPTRDTWQLYRLDEDPGETNNLAADNPQKVNELEELLTRVRNEE